MRAAAGLASALNNNRGIQSKPGPPPQPRTLPAQSRVRCGRAEPARGMPMHSKAFHSLSCQSQLREVLPSLILKTQTHNNPKENRTHVRHGLPECFTVRGSPLHTAGTNCNGNSTPASDSLKMTNRYRPPPRRDPGGMSVLNPKHPCLQGPLALLPATLGAQTPGSTCRIQRANSQPDGPTAFLQPCLRIDTGRICEDTLWSQPCLSLRGPVLSQLIVYSLAV